MKKMKKWTKKASVEDLDEHLSSSYILYISERKKGGRGKEKEKEEVREKEKDREEKVMCSTTQLNWDSQEKAIRSEAIDFRLEPNPRNVPAAFLSSFEHTS